MGSSVFVENNYFRGTFRPMMSSKQGTDATGDGTFSGESGGIIKSFGNVFAEKPKNFSFITYQANNTSFDAYEATTRDEVVPATVVTLAGGTAYNNFDTDASLMHDGTVDAAGDVPGIVALLAQGDKVADHIFNADGGHNAVYGLLFDHD